MPEPSPELDEPNARGFFQLAAGIVLLALSPLLGWLYAPIHRPMDEGQLLVYPDLILRGFAPFRDFLMSYPPGNYFALAGAYALFGVDLEVERLVGLAYRAGLALSIVRLGWKRGPGIAMLGGVACALLLAPLRLDAYSWIGGIALLVAALSLLDSARAASTAGARGSAPLIAVAAIASPLAVFQTLVYETVISTGPNRRIPFSALTPALWRDVALVAISTGAALAAALRSAVRDGISSRPARSALAAAGLCVGVLPQAFQRLDEDHLLYVACLTVGLLPASIDRLGSGPPPLRRKLTVSASAIAVAFCVAPFAGLSAHLLGSAARGDRAPEFVRGERSVRVRSAGERDDLARVVAQLDELTNAGDRLLIAPVDLRRTNYCDLSLYHLFPEPVPASFHLEMLPGTTNREGSRFAADLGTADVIVSSRRWENWRQPDGSMWIGTSAPVAVRDAEFELVGQHGHWLVHARRDRARRDGLERASSSAP